MPNTRKTKNNKEKKVSIAILRIFAAISPHRWIANVLALILGAVLQCCCSGCIINLLSVGMYEHLKSSSLVLGMASTIGLSMIVIFGFNFSKSVQEDYKGTLKERGIENTEQAKSLEMGIHYLQMLWLILLYICIVMDWFTFFYVLFAYDVLCYIVLVIKLWLIKSVGVAYIFENYRQMDQKHKQAEMQSILQNCVENNGNVNVRAINSYIELLFIYLKENIAKKNDDKYDEEKFYGEARQIINDSMDKLVLGKNVQSLLLISIIRQFCKKWDGLRIKETEYQLFLAVLITYVLDREKNIDTDFIYKELVGWNDESTELRYCIAVSRMEYLNATSERNQEVLLSNHIYYLYRLVTVKESFKDLICLLWYLWCEEDGKCLTAHVNDMNRFIDFFHRETRISSIGDIANSLYMLVNGLRY